jgi:hypothetical protein
MKDNDDSVTYTVDEVVGVFDSAERLEAGIDVLEESGFDRAALNVMAATTAVEQKLGDRFRRIEDIEDDPDVIRPLYVTRHEMAEGATAAIGVPIYIGAMAGLIGVAATGGALALAAAAAAAAGGLGGGLGILFVKHLGDRHAGMLERSLKRGGLILLARVASQEEARRAQDALRKLGATDVHQHRVARTWGADDIPLSHWNPDPFLIE